MAETVLAKMAVEIAANTANFNKSLQATQSKLTNFTSGLSNIASTVGVAFGVGAVTSFAFEVAKLAGEAEGVSAAFNRFPESERLMNRLKEATHGTVSELELMKRSVQAANFGIELESLPKLLEFAAIRAQQTGQSVDYLVDSIVTGIGRKSPLILDNLGISAVALKEKMGGVALATASIGEVSKAVGAIASDELDKMGGFSENTATKVARLSASWENFKVVLGNVVNAGGILAGVLDGLANLANSISDPRNSGFIILQKNLAESIRNESEPAVKTMVRQLSLLRNELDTPISVDFAKQLTKDFELSEEQSKRFLKIVNEINGEIKKVEPVKVADPVQVTTLETLQEKVKELNEQFVQTDVNDQKRLTNIGREIIAVNQQIKVLEELRKAREGGQVVQPDTVNAYQEALSKLNKELEDTNVKDTSRIRILSAQIASYQEAIKNVENLKKSFQDFDFVVKPPNTEQLLNPIKEIKDSVGGISFTTLSDSMTEVTNRFEEGLAKMAETSKVRGAEISGTFIDMGGLIAGAAVGIGEALGGAIAGTENFGQAILKVVVGFAKQLGEILIATGTAMLAAKKLISNPYTAIVAGIALVAIAGAAGAAISKASNSAFGGGSSAGGGRATPVSNERITNGLSNELRLDFDAKFRIEGNDLVAVTNSTNKQNGRLRG